MTKQFSNYRNFKSITNKIVKGLLLTSTLICASIILIIIFMIASTGLRPVFQDYLVDVNGQTTYVRLDFFNFLVGTTHISPTYQIGFIIINTLYVVLLAILVATPIGVLNALFIVKLAPNLIKKVLTTVIEALSSIPSIIFGMFGLGFISKIVAAISLNVFNNPIGLTSTLTTILVLSIMILPIITQMSITAIESVPKELENASISLGTSKIYTYFKITLKKAKGGIFAGIVLAVGRALGEATAVSIVAGNSASGPNFDLFSSTRTLTSTMLSGLKETSGFNYDVRFTMGLVLIIIIIGSNLLLNYFKKRMSKYDE